MIGRLFGFAAPTKPEHVTIKNHLHSTTQIHIHQIMLFNPTLKEVRQFFYHAWHKSLANQALAPIETIAVKWMRVHPEYHAVLNGPIEALESAQFLPRDGQTNPFCTCPCTYPSANRCPSTSRPAFAPPTKNSAKSTMTNTPPRTSSWKHSGKFFGSRNATKEPDGAAYIDMILRAAAD